MSQELRTSFQTQSRTEGRQTHRIGGRRIANRPMLRMNPRNLVSAITFLHICIFARLVAVLVSAQSLRLNSLHTIEKQLYYLGLPCCFFNCVRTAYAQSGPGWR
jgi:hypothetical protein